MNIVSMYKSLASKYSDKLLHFAFGYATVLTLLLFVNIPIALISVILIALLKEILDGKVLHGTQDKFDFVVTVVGGLIAVIPFIVSR